MSTNHKRSICITSLNVVFVVLVIAVSASFSSEINDLRYVGSVEGKSYFAEITENRDWYEANAFCEYSGMRLASITTTVQRDFIGNAQNADTFPRHGYWTGGRIRADYLSPSDFAWAHNGERVDKSTVLHFWRVPEFNIDACLLIGNYPNTDFQHDAQLCSNKAYTLCELTTG